MNQDVAGALARYVLALGALAAGGCPGPRKAEPHVPPAPPPAKEDAAPAQPASEPRKVYLTAGHGELTHPASQPAGLPHERRSSELRRVIGLFDYEVAELAAADLARAVPDDAAIVLVAAPALPLQPAEWTALDRYLERGGRLLIVLDPTGATSMGPLEGRLGLRMLAGHLADDKNFMPVKGTPSDRRTAITNQFSAHPSTIGLSRAGGKGMLTIDAGALEEIPFTSKGQALTRTITIRSMDSAWLDLEQPQNFTFDDATERRGHWNLGAAIEGPRTAGRAGFRALVFSDAEMLADVLILGPQGRPQPALLSGPLVTDAISWLGGRPPARDTGTAAAPKKDKSGPPTPRREHLAPPPEAHTLPSGTRYIVLRAGTGPEKPRSFNRVTFHLTSWDSDGRQLESTEARQQPETTHPFGRRPAVEEVLTSMTVDQRVRFWLDAARAVPDASAPGAPKGLVTYELELLQIDPAAAPPPPVPPDVAKPPAGAKKTAAGTHYRVLKAGKGGPRPKPTDSVVVHYTGWTTDGRMFDSSIIRGASAEFRLDSVIAGWTDGLQVMSVGDKVRFWIPEALAYKGMPARPQGTLVFDVELLEIKQEP